MRYLKDSSGNIFKADIISEIPAGFTDITKQLDLNGLESVPFELLELEEVAEVPAIEAKPISWTDGTEVVFDPNDIHTVMVDGEAELDPAWTMIPEVVGVAKIPAHCRLIKKSSADQSLRQAIMDRITKMRAPLLADADIEINKLEDAGSDSSAMRTYRQALRDITEPYKKVNGDWKASVDSLDVDSFTFPSKP